MITLTTDFGPGSPYVAAMKARLLAGCPSAVLVDVSHSLPAFQAEPAAFVLWAGTRHFGAGSVHLCVVDPGVGGGRRALAFELSGSFYVGPDSGVFATVLREGLPARPDGVALARPEGASPTFEGRDVFAPAAASLAAGVPLSEVGARPVDLAAPPPAPPAVVWVDAFGNLVTSLKPPVAGVRIGSNEVRRAARTYSEAPPGEPFWYVGSMGLVEVAVREESAARRLRAGPGTPVAAI